MIPAAKRSDSLRTDCMENACPIEQVSSGYYLRLSVVDEPGVLAQVASILGSHQIGISSVIQPEGHEGDAVPLVLDHPRCTVW